MASRARMGFMITQESIAWKIQELFFYPSTDVFIITTSDSLSMFIYSQKHVQLPYFHHVMLVFHRQIRREALSESSSPEGMFILDAALLASELMTFIMPCWRVEHECLVSWKNHAIFYQHAIYLKFISAILWCDFPVENSKLTRTRTLKNDFSCFVGGKNMLGWGGKFGKWCDVDLKRIL